MRVSIVVPTYRRPDLLARCLAALAAQRFPAQEYEILVADDAGVEATRLQVEEFARDKQMVIRYLRVQERHGPAAARNVGWRAAAASLIAFTDDDCMPDAGWLAAGTTALESDLSLSAVSGRTIVPLPERPTDHERNAAGLEQAEFLTANCFCRRSVLQQIGGLDERFTMAWREDSDLQFSILERGGRVARIADAVVIHPVRATRWGNCLREQRKAVFEALLFRKHPALYRQRIWPRTPWDYYAMVVALVAFLVAVQVASMVVAGLAAGIWLVLMCRFLGRRLRHNTLAPSHVVEMIATSLLIPPLSVYWRLAGAVRYRVVFL